MITHTSNCLNSNEFYKKVKLIVRNDEYYGYSLVSLDFDNFNFINDLFGYEIGNRTLKRIEEKFGKMLCEGEYFSRIHADHFVFLIREIENQSVDQRFMEFFCKKSVVNYVFPPNFNFVCSGGIVSLSENAESLSTILDKANFARKRAKGNYVTTFVFFTNEMNKELNWKKNITLSMENALKNDEFKLYLQPKFLIENKKIVGAEALVRWNSSDYGFLYPDMFLPILEQNGFIVKLDFCMFEKACKHLRSCIDNNTAVLPISVNFSKLHISMDNFVEKVYKTTKKYDILPQLIEIELTENIFLNDFQRVVKILKELKKLGFKVALDDFGKMYSSLNYLKDLPLDIIKIDKEFLNYYKSGNTGEIVITKIIDLIKSLNMISVMEGVETSEQLEFLKRLGCNMCQGYFFSRPISEKSFIEFVNKYEYNIDSFHEPSWDVWMENDSHVENDLKINDFESLVKKEQESKEKYQLILEESVVFEWKFAEDIIEFSGDFDESFGLTPIINNVSDSLVLKNKIHDSDRAIYENFIENTYNKSKNNNIECRVQTRKGNYVWVRVQTIAICEGDRPTKAIGVISNIDKEKKNLDKLSSRASLDSLTKIFNKEVFCSQTELYIKENPDKNSAFIILDIDNFKGLNDNLGHQFGDGVIKEVAEKIRCSFANNDIVGRVGGDEFAVFICDFKSQNEVYEKIEKLMENIHKTYYGVNGKYDITISIGVSFYPIHGKDFSSLYNRSDIALYQTKRTGKNNFTVYEEDMTPLVTNNLTPLESSRRFLNSYFAGDLIFNVFEMLYETKDITTTIDRILNLLGNEFNVDRVYIFEYTQDEQFFNNTYEWCASGVTSEQAYLQNLSTEAFMGFFNAYNDEGLLYCNNITLMDTITYETLKKQGIKSFLHCALFNEGRQTGFLGFDDCKSERVWRGDEIAVLGYISRVLSVFLMRTKIKQELLTSYKNHVEMLENLNGYVYVVNIKTHKILYLNNAAKSTGLKLSNKCYIEAFGAETPCQNCPIKKLNKSNNSAAAEIYSEKLNGWVYSAASKFKWEGNEDAALICCTDISKYKK